MKFTVMTLFPEMVLSGLNTSIIGRAVKAGIISIDAVNIRDYTNDKHKHVDDYPYGGGAGMVMMAEPVYRCYLDVTGKSGETGAEGTKDSSENDSKKRVIYLTPQGKTFNQAMAKEFAKEEELIFLCGHYEGVDERVLEEIVTDEVSIGDYVLSGGELPAMVMIDAIARMVPGVLTNEESGINESFEGNLLEYPQYTRPEEWKGKKVPDVLLSGHHANIEKWRREKQIEKTLKVRPELLENAELSRKEEIYLEKLKN
ncbi:MAG: tRNA (guanosine(37)-N1)-methyltransferase TrmD [Lachnospiraceae bacterium]|nr:tRNA (guanosine(37)-N1)-methyltransferase TrmD [Lachnospiraceae bacterium]